MPPRKAPSSLRAWLDDVPSMGEFLGRHGADPVPLAPGYERLRQDLIERMRRRAREQAMVWACGLSMWVDRWTPYYVSPQALIERGDQALANLLITVSKAGLAIRA